MLIYKTQAISCVCGLEMMIFQATLVWLNWADQSSGHKWWVMTGVPDRRPRLGLGVNPRPNSLQSTILPLNHYLTPKLLPYMKPRWLSGLMRSRVHSLWLLVDHCVLRNWDRILVRAVKGLISRAGMVSICPLLWQRDVKLQQTNYHTCTLPLKDALCRCLRRY